MRNAFLSASVVVLCASFLACGTGGTQPPVDNDVEEVGDDVEDVAQDGAADAPDAADPAPGDEAVAPDEAEVPDTTDLPGDEATVEVEPDSPVETDAPPECVEDCPCKKDSDCPSEDACNVGRCELACNASKPSCLDGFGKCHPERPGCLSEDGTCTTLAPDCDDGFKCTLDGCDPASGGCFHQYDQGGCEEVACTKATEAAACAAHPAATPCSQKRCVPCPVPVEPFLDYFDCPDTGMVCQVRPCDGCDDGDACTVDSCDSTGKVANAPVECEDYSNCTLDECLPCEGDGCLASPFRCVFTPKTACIECPPISNCEANEPPCMKTVACTDDGCAFEKVSCDDQDPQTIDWCDPTQPEEMQCVHKPIGMDPCGDETPPGETSDECGDDNLCTLEWCVDLCKDRDVDPPCEAEERRLFCRGAEDPCVDDDPTTVDGLCDPAKGCVFPKVPVKCDAGKCDDGNPCTMEHCDEAKNECVVDGLRTCAGAAPCTSDTCAPETGCVHTPVCKCLEDIDCALLPCLTATCVPDAFGIKTCKYASACDDGNNCTLDFCSETGCIHKPGPCVCDPTKGAADCVLPDACTVAACDPASRTCSFAAKDCKDQDACTLEYCDPVLGCRQPIDPKCVCTKNEDCDDDDLCTEEHCDKDALRCVYSKTPCVDGDECTYDGVCDAAKGCQFPKKPSSECQHCSSGQLWQCIPFDKCHVAAACDTSKDPKGVCVFEELPCGGGSNPCITGKCNPATGGCDFVPTPTDDGDLCTVDSCDEFAGVEHVEKYCGDGNPCTDDYCDPLDGDCKGAPKACDDHDVCTVDDCDPGSGV
ncbi:MAG: hypothetical protein FJ087_18380, partial [Deltaproteobacteria bacterium]|nr:hypothetical protein [Deltaproteobacteria bacterium]